MTTERTAELKGAQSDAAITAFVTEHYSTSPSESRGQRNMGTVWRNGGPSRRLLARGGRAVARLVPVSVCTQRRKLGLLRGQVWIAPDFDAPEVNEDIARSFEA